MKPKLILLAAFVLVFCGSHAQNCTGNVIRMQLDTGAYDDRKKAFDNLKQATLQSAAGVNTDQRVIDVITLSNMLSLVARLSAMGNGMRVYVGAYTATDSQADNIFKENTLVPIFVATQETLNKGNQDFGGYFVFNTQTHQYQQVSPKSASIWYTNYKKPGGIREKLSQNIIDAPKDETLSLWYNGDDLKAWLMEMTCLNASGSINQVEISWGAFEKNMFFRESGVYHLLNVKDKLTLTFRVPGINVERKADPELRKYLKYSSELFDLYTAATGSPDAKKPTPADKKNKAKLLLTFRDIDYDTAVPCPPGENCGLGNLLP